MSEEMGVYETEQQPIADIPEATFDEILAQYEREEEEFEYTVGEGEKARKFRARRIVSLQEKIELTERADTFLEFVNSKGVPEQWRPYLKKKPGKKVANMIIFASSLLIAPKLSQFQCLRMAATCGDALIEIAGPLLGATEQSVTEAEDAAVDDAKNA